MASKQLILMRPDGSPLGTKAEVMAVLARFNTAPDGSAEALGVAFGPGFHVELPWVGDGDDLANAAVTVADQDGAWLVLSRMMRELDWRLMDLDTGQVFGEPSA